MQASILSPTLLSVILWCLPVVGVFVLVIAIRTISGSFNGKLIAEIPFIEKESHFAIAQPGIYAVWQRGPLLTKTRIAEFRLNLAEQASGKAIMLSTSWFAPHVNTFDTARVEWKRFDAKPGRYLFNIMEEGEANVFENLFNRILPFKKVEPKDYFFEIRMAQPIYKFFLTIPMFTLAVLLIFGGPALALNAKEVAAYFNVWLLKG
jgi:hypothetical protein